jgi:hypothetical protein
MRLVGAHTREHRSEPCAVVPDRTGGNVEKDGERFRATALLRSRRRLLLRSKGAC